MFNKERSDEGVSYFQKLLKLVHLTVIYNSQNNSSVLNSAKTLSYFTKFLWIGTKITSWSLVTPGNRPLSQVPKTCCLVILVILVMAHDPLLKALESDSSSNFHAVDFVWMNPSLPQRSCSAGRRSWSGDFFLHDWHSLYHWDTSCVKSIFQLSLISAFVTHISLSSSKWTCWKL